jgi:POT family proton-dependent oligopeptide transporter
MRRFLGSHPPGLPVLFFTELGERFGFFAIQAIFILYVTRGLGYSDQEGFLLYGAFSAMLYLMPVVGGYIADRLLGFRDSIYIGSLLYLVAYLLMALPGREIFFVGMSAMAVAHGFLKPNISSLLGRLYPRKDTGRDSGFTLFYMGINIGAMLPPLFIGDLVAKEGWHAGFLAAALGMAGAFGMFYAGQKRLERAGLPPTDGPLAQERRRWGKWHWRLVGGAVGAIGLIFLAFHDPRDMDIVLISATALVFISLFFLIRKEAASDRRRLKACVLLILIAGGFWAIYGQTFTSLMLYADRNMSKEWLGLTINAEFTQFFNPFFIVLLSPLLSYVWLKLDREKRHLSTPAKFSIAMVCMAGGLFFLSAGVRVVGPDGLSSPWWLIGSYFLQTVGELFISPIGLAMVTRLSPPHLSGMMMGVWFLVQSVSSVASAGLAQFADVPTGATLAESTAIYSHAFWIYGLCASGLTGLSLAAIPTLKKMIADHPHRKTNF